MRLTEQQIVSDASLRAQAIKEITSSENLLRKEKHLRRFNVYKDGVRQYVLEIFKKEFGNEVVLDVENRVSSVNVCKKIVNKKARVYKDSIIRDISNKPRNRWGMLGEVIDKVMKTDEKKKALFDDLMTATRLDTFMKKVNRFVELQKNVLVRVTPILDEETGKYYPKLVALQPHDYDVIEDANDPEKPIAVIMTAVGALKSPAPLPNVQGTGRELKKGLSPDFRKGDGKDQSIADSPADKGADDSEYIWWTRSNHFTTDVNGNIIKTPKENDTTNPIGKLPFVNFCGDQDNNYWAMGGDDIVEGSILVNVGLTDVNYIAKYQGMGIFYAFGKNIPRTIKVGPNDAIVIDLQDGDPTPQVGFASANPPLDQHLNLIKEQLSMLLATNDLEPTAATGSLSGGAATSGVQEIIQRSEPTANVEDERAQYTFKEPEIIRLVIAWCNAYSKDGFLHPDWAPFASLDPSIDYSMRFQSAQVFSSEREKIEVINLRRDSGLDTMEDSIRLDNPNLTDEQVKERVKKLGEEKANAPAPPVPPVADDKETDEDEDEVEEEEKDK